MTHLFPLRFLAFLPDITSSKSIPLPSRGDVGRSQWCLAAAYVMPNGSPVATARGFHVAWHGGPGTPKGHFRLFWGNCSMMLVRIYVRVYVYIYIWFYITIFTVINLFGDGEFHWCCYHSIDGLRKYWLGILIDGIIVNLGQGAETSFKFFNAAPRAKYQFL